MPEEDEVTRPAATLGAALPSATRPDAGSSTTGDRPAGARSAQRALGVALWIIGLGAASFGGLRPTNFRGYDEWLIFWMLSRGVVSFPHAGRPLGLVWHFPAWLFAPDRLWGFLVVHAAWLTVVGILTFLLFRRLRPRETAAAFLAGAFAVAWMPSELTRVASVQMIQYSGATAGALAAAWLFVEAWHLSRPALLVVAASVAAVTALSLEATLPLLGLSASLLLGLGGRTDLKRRLLWTGGAWALVAAAAGRLALLALAGHGGLSYQTEILGATRTPLGVGRQIVRQLRFQLDPLVAAPGDELASGTVALVTLVFVGGFVFATRGDTDAGRPGRKGLLLAALVGVGFSAAGYFPFVLARAIRGPERTEFLASPGVAVLLAALVVLVASYLPRRLRVAATCLAGAWIVAVGTGRTLALQQQQPGAYAAQRRMLLRLSELAPRVAAHSLILLPRNGSTWTFEFSAVKAVEYLYEGQARGSAPGAMPVLYATRLEATAVVSEPSPALQSGWGEPVERYRYDEVLAFGEDAAGRLALLEAWPTEDLGALPAGTLYAPRRRIRSDQPASSRFAILDPAP